MHFVEAKSLLTRWNGMNLYRGCTHGCIYCDSRSTCYQFQHRFEDVEVKQNAPELLEKILRSKRKKAVIGSGSMSDPYQSCEKQLMLTRRCLELLDLDRHFPGLSEQYRRQYGNAYEMLSPRHAELMQYSYERSNNGFKFIIYRPQTISDILNVTYGDALNITEQAVYAVLRQNPEISREELAERVSKTVRTVQRALARPENPYFTGTNRRCTQACRFGCIWVHRMIVSKSLSMGIKFSKSFLLWHKAKEKISKSVKRRSLPRQSRQK